jgi:hypothetical protein
MASSGNNDSFPFGGGEMGALIGSRDWSAAGLGPISGWPQSLKTTVGILLRSPVPIVLLWGPDGIMIYNDAYSAFAEGRHPVLFGSKVREGWPEVADFNDNVMRVGLSGSRPYVRGAARAKAPSARSVRGRLHRVRRRRLCEGWTRR